MRTVVAGIQTRHGESILLVKGCIANGWMGADESLMAVPVVRIQVQYSDFPTTQPIQRVASSHRCKIEDTKPHSLPCESVVSRRAGQGKRRATDTIVDPRGQVVSVFSWHFLHLPQESPLDTVHPGGSRQQAHIICCAIYIRISVHATTPAF